MQSHDGARCLIILANYGLMNAKQEKTGTVFLYLSQFWHTWIHGLIGEKYEENMKETSKPRGDSPLMTDPQPTSSPTSTPQQKNKKGDIWHLTRDTWLMTCDTWHKIYDIWHMCGFWTEGFLKIRGKGWVNESINFLISQFESFNNFNMLDHSRVLPSWPFQNITFLTISVFYIPDLDFFLNVFLTFPDMLNSGTFQKVYFLELTIYRLYIPNQSRVSKFWLISSNIAHIYIYLISCDMNTEIQWLNLHGD